jgi:ribonuclease BN (tRNA processing enzyme)
MRLTIVGCAGSFPSPDSAASCYLVEADDDTGRRWRLVLDLGSGALGPLQRYVVPADIDAVLISHLHPDHCVDLCGLFVALRYDPAGRVQRRVPVYGPSDTAQRLDAMYGVDANGSLSEVFDVRAWHEGDPVRIGPLTVTPLRVDHPVEAYGLRVEQLSEHRTSVLAYSGDTDACPALVSLAKGADALLAEAAFTEGRDQERHIHMTGLRAGRLAADAGARRLLLTHLPVWTDPSRARAEAESAFAGEIVVVSAGDVLDV